MYWVGLAVSCFMLPHSSATNYKTTALCFIFTIIWNYNITKKSLLARPNVEIGPYRWTTMPKFKIVLHRAITSCVHKIAKEIVVTLPNDKKSLCRVKKNLKIENSFTYEPLCLNSKLFLTDKSHGRTDTQHLDTRMSSHSLGPRKGLKTCFGSFKW